MNRFEWWGPDHLAALGATLVLAGIAIAVGRRRRGEWPADLVRWALALLLAGCMVAWHVRKLRRGSWDLDDSLPLQLCDVAGVAALVALVRPRTWSFELLWFWGLAATAQALITPDVRAGFPDPLYLMFFIHHGGIVVAALFMGPGLRMKARRGAPWRMMLVTNLLLLAAGLANGITGGNYMYLARPPAGGSLLDLMGPWPWYIATGQLVALALYFLLDLPFRAARKRRVEAA